MRYYGGKDKLLDLIEIEKEKRAGSYPNFPMISFSRSLSPSTSVGTPSIGTTFTVVQSSPSPSVMGGSPGFLSKSTQCIDCGRDRDNETYFCNECRLRRRI